MKKYVLGAFIGFLLLMSGCRDRQDGVHTEDTDLQKEKLTIMHVDAESPGFRKFIENAEKELNLEIETIAALQMQMCGRLKSPRFWKPEILQSISSLSMMR